MKFRERIVWINPFHSEHVSIQTDLSPTQCVEVIREATVSRYSPRTWFTSDRDEWPVIGGVSGHRFWIQRIHTFEASWLLQQASGLIEQTDSASVIHLRISMKPVSAILVVVLGVVACAVALIGASSLYSAPWPPLAWALWPLAGLAKYLLDRLWWAGDAQFLSAFVSDVIGKGHLRPWRLYASAHPQRGGA